MSEQQKPVIEIVSKIFLPKKSDAAADTSELERQIDRIVYGLYGLTEEEVRVIEGEK